MHQLMAGLILFLGVHSVSIVAPATRDRWAALMGPNLWRALYSLVALAGFVLVARGYAAARLEPVVVYVPPGWTRHLTMALMLPVFVLLFGGFLAWAVVDRISLKRRVQRPVPGAPASRWNDGAALVLGLAAYGAFAAWLHPMLIGVPVLPR